MKRYLDIDRLLLLSILALVGFGMVIIYSSSGPYAESIGKTSGFFLVSHLKKIILGFVFLGIGLSIDHSVWMKLSRPMFLVSIVLLILVLVRGVSAHGATRWLNIGGFEFQPSELMKISLFMLLATKLSELKNDIKDFKAGFVRPMLLVGIVFVLILAQPNYSTATSLVIVSLAMLYVGGTQLKHLLLVGAAAVPMLGILAVSSPYRMKRVLALFDPSANEGSSYQQLQSLISLGNGGVWGTGLGNGTQKLGYLPMPFTDTIYAILGEELGFAGTTLILVLFGIITWRGIQAAKRSHSKFGMLLALALTTAIAVNVFMHVGVCTRILPATGQPLPLVSYGGTNLLMNLFALGVLLNISNPHMGEKIEMEMREDYL